MALQTEKKAQEFYVLVRALDGKRPEDTAWDAMLLRIGLSWQRYELDNDDAAALESMLRSMRFPRR